MTAAADPDGHQPPVDEAKRSWAARVRFAGGDDSFAYVPNHFLVGADETGAAVRALAPGAQRVIVEQPCEGSERSDVAGGYTRWQYDGDVLSVVRRLRAAGIKAQPLHVFFLDAGPGDVAANPVYGNPVYGNPVYGNPVYGNPVYGNPVYGNPVYGNPVYGNPVYGNPVYGNPVYGNPGYGSPALIASHCACDDADKCQCPATPTAAPASGVYPNPVYVAKAYPSGEGVTYRLTGQRRSQAMPLLGVSKNNIGKVQPWATAAVRIAVLDNGFSPDAAVAPVADSQSDVDGDGDAEPDGDKDRYLDPVAGHGTFIGGLIARIAPGCGLKIYSPLTAYGDGNEFDIAKLIETIITQEHPPHFLNLSFSGYALEDKAADCLHKAIQAAMKQGIVVVASAGNDGVSRKAFPAAFPGVVSVAALGHDGPAPFSNWGSWVRACAPGVDIVSTFFNYSQGREREKYGVDPDEFKGWAIWSGTSFSAPVVTAVLARAVQAAKLQEEPADPRPPFSPYDAVEAIIDQDGLYRLRCYGTVVNQLAVRPLCQ